MQPGTRISFRINKVLFDLILSYLHLPILYLSFRQEAVPPEPLPIVINRYSDDQLRAIVKNMRERTDLYKEKVVDQYASSPEITPPVSE